MWRECSTTVFIVILHTTTQRAARGKGYWSKGNRTNNKNIDSIQHKLDTDWIHPWLGLRRTIAISSCRVFYHFDNRFQTYTPSKKVHGSTTANVRLEPIACFCYCRAYCVPAHGFSQPAEIALNCDKKKKVCTWTIFAPSPKKTIKTLKVKWKKTHLQTRAK